MKSYQLKILFLLKHLINIDNDMFQESKNVAEKQKYQIFVFIVLIVNVSIENWKTLKIYINYRNYFILKYVLIIDRF